MLSAVQQVANLSLANITFTHNTNPLKHSHMWTEPTLSALIYTHSQHRWIFTIFTPSCFMLCCTVRCQMRTQKNRIHTSTERTTTFRPAPDAHKTFNRHLIFMKSNCAEYIKSICTSISHSYSYRFRSTTYHIQTNGNVQNSNVRFLWFQWDKFV